ncbi:MAG: glycosyltransferase [Bacteroidetes bacterium]|nr:glycosyltransferase [Bacteroidota bacterium]MCB9225552.1 glycosyltransferase [Chitinophagales bacterium]
MIDVLIVILTYNQENYIEKAVQSVLMQETRFNYQLVVINDSSTDNTLNVLKKYNSNIEVYTTAKNLGAAYAFLDFYKGVQNQYKYIALLDGDDEWLVNYKLQSQYDFLEKHSDYILTTHDAINCNEYGEKIDLYSTRYHIPEVSGFEAVLEKQRWPTSSFFMRNFLVDSSYENLIQHYKYNSDWILTIYLSTLGKIHFHNQALSKRTIRLVGRNQTVGGDNYLKFQIKVLKQLKYLQFLKNHINEVNFALAGRYLKLFDYYREKGIYKPILYINFMLYFKPTSFVELKFLAHTIKKPINAFFFKTYFEDFSKKN